MDDKKEPFLVSLDVTGTPNNKRFMIVNNLNEVWDGHEWTKDHSKGRLFHDAMDTQEELQIAYKQHFNHLPLTTTYVCNFEVKVLSQKEIPIEQVKEWLVNSTQFSFDYVHNGSGPENDSLVHAFIRYSMLMKTGIELKEIKHDASQ